MPEQLEELPEITQEEIAKNRFSLKRNGQELSLVPTYVKRGERRGLKYPGIDTEMHSPLEVEKYMGEDWTKQRVFSGANQIFSSIAFSKANLNPDGSFNLENFKKEAISLVATRVNISDLEKLAANTQKEIFGLMETYGQHMGSGRQDEAKKVLAIIFDKQRAVKYYMETADSKRRTKDEDES